MKERKKRGKCSFVSPACGARPARGRAAGRQRCPPGAGNAAGPPFCKIPARAELPHAWPASRGVEIAERLSFPSARSLVLSWLNPTSTKRGEESSDHCPVPALLWRGDPGAQRPAAEKQPQPPLCCLHALTKTDPSHQQRRFYSADSSASSVWDVTATPASLFSCSDSLAAHQALPSAAPAPAAPAGGCEPIWRGCAGSSASSPRQQPCLPEKRKLRSTSSLGSLRSHLT